jgi:hypothetical protein
MQLSELGELGLLAELERRGVARGIDHDAAHPVSYKHIKLPTKREV